MKNRFPLSSKFSSLSLSRNLSLPLLLCLILSIVQKTWGESIEAESALLDSSPTCTGSPTCSSTSQEIQSASNNETVSPFLQSFLEAYGETVDTIVGLQTSSWNYHGQYHAFEESEVEGFCESLNTAHLSSGTPKYKLGGKKAKNETEAKEKPKKEWSLPDDFEYDREEDIDGYFAKILEGCSQDIEDEAAADRFATECFDRLKEIVWKPRCTTRYDSRVECNGETPGQLQPTSELIQDHFGTGEDSLNVVIIGAGPIGLMLGNALSMLQRRQTDKGSIPPIKTLFIESRADAPGVKRPYSRNWQSHMSLMHFRHALDPRLIKIVAALGINKDEPESSPGMFVFPLNVIETILLLSNRDLGASKFLYGIDALDIVDDLKEIPNLVLVDATGHRLEPLRRGPICLDDDDKSGEDKGQKSGICQEEIEQKVTRNHRTPPSPEIPWQNAENKEFYENALTFDMDFTSTFEFAERHGSYLHVGQYGDLMYPVNEENVAKSYWWLDVHGAMPLTPRGFARESKEASNGLYATEGNVCSFCKAWFEKVDIYAEDYFPKSEREHSNNYNCNRMCYAAYYAQSTELLRPDINRHIFGGRFNDTFVYNSDSWFPIMGYSFNPSVVVANEAEKVLSAHGYSSDPIGMPLKEFIPALMQSADPTQFSHEDIQMLTAYFRYSLQMNTSKWPTVTLFVQQPFIYTNGIKKKNRCLGKSSPSLGDHLEHAPELRFGDSFTIGDGLNGAGIYTHATMINVFMDLILHKAGGLPSSSQATS